ncbi:MAG: 4Fe-4S dicluster domain-containing protein [Gallionella sp.]|nr:4Fe-4S dicluster domain-containing protein [Gallionella sp.]
MNSIDTRRRGFLKTSLGAAAVAIAPGMLLFDMAHGNSEAVSSKTRWGMLIDTAQCKEGCNDCVTACNQENGLSGSTNVQARSPLPNPLPVENPSPQSSPASGRGGERERLSSNPAGEGTNDSLREPRLKPTDSQWIRKIEIKEIGSGRKLSLPMMCQHCEHPPCVDVCPTGASFKRADGIVLVDRHRCIGCRYCMMACPYKARSFVHEPLHDQKPDVPRGKGTVESCTLCVHRVDQGKQPACAEVCPNKAILFGNLNDPESEIAQKVRSVASVQVRADLRLNPGVRYQGL